jgi:hypothetical protein
MQLQKFFEKDNITLTKLMCGHLVFIHDCPKLMRRSILSGRLKPNPRMKDEWGELYKRMTSMNPDARPTINDLLSNPWVSERKDAE